MMNSSIPEVSIQDHIQRLRFNKAQRRVPLSGILELTLRCNNRCMHCYINKNIHDGGERKRELTYSQMCRILDEIAEEGCLWLLFTGGEPLVREDFPRIYAYAKRRGFLITLFTNGTLIDPEVADFLRELPPRSIEITLYGMSEDAYEHVTRVPGSYARCMRGIELLIERNLPLKLKAVIITVNRHELGKMKAFSENLGLEFRFDPLLNLRVDGGKSPAKLRLSPREVVEMDLADEKRRTDLVEFYERFNKFDEKSQCIFRCGAGVNSFHIDPYGFLHICTLVRNPGYDLKHGSFRDGWDTFLPGIRAQTRKEDNKCADCNLHLLCGQCPGWSQLEHGDLEKPVEYLCQVGHLRGQLLGIGNEKGKPIHTEFEG